MASMDIAKLSPYIMAILPFPTCVQSISYSIPYGQVLLGYLFVLRPQPPIASQSNKTLGLVKLKSIAFEG